MRSIPKSQTPTFAPSSDASGSELSSAGRMIALRKNVRLIVSKNGSQSPKTLPENGLYFSSSLYFFLFFSGQISGVGVAYGSSKSDLHAGTAVQNSVGQNSVGRAPLRLQTRLSRKNRLKSGYWGFLDPRDGSPAARSQTKSLPPGANNFPGSSA